MRICATCSRDFKQSSNHKDCPSCRYQKTKTVLCKGCHKNIHSTKYKNCIGCTNTFKSNYGKGRHYKSGYVMIYKENHPRNKGKKGNYVFEHILVLEKHLGRHLTMNENVHHKNGLRDDNRIQNLELWIRPQPTGIRVEDDFEWALQIISKYAQMQKE